MMLVKKFKYYLNNPLVLAILGNIAMVAARIGYTRDFYYGFLLWNLFLAATPLFVSYYMQKKNISTGFAFYALLVLWMLFLPNAPYIITDLVHLYHRPPVPFWYDMLLVLLSAINGLVLGFVSLGQIEQLLKQKQHFRSLEIVRIFLFLLMSYGVYMGRYLRFNSWDAFLNPISILKEVIDSISAGTLAFTFTFAFVNYALYKFYQAILLRRTQGVS